MPAAGGAAGAGGRPSGRIASPPPRLRPTPRRQPSPPAPAHGSSKDHPSPIRRFAHASAVAKAAPQAPPPPPPGVWAPNHQRPERCPPSLRAPPRQRRATATSQHARHAGGWEGHTARTTSSSFSATQPPVSAADRKRAPSEPGTRDFATEASKESTALFQPAGHQDSTDSMERPVTTDSASISQCAAGLVSIRGGGAVAMATLGHQREAAPAAGDPLRLAPVPLPTPSALRLGTQFWSLKAVAFSGPSPVDLSRAGPLQHSIADNQGSMPDLSIVDNPGSMQQRTGTTAPTNSSSGQPPAESRDHVKQSFSSPPATSALTKSATQSTHPSSGMQQRIGTTASANSSIGQPPADSRDRIKQSFSSPLAASAMTKFTTASHHPSSGMPFPWYENRSSFLDTAPGGAAVRAGTEGFEEKSRTWHGGRSKPVEVGKALRLGKLPSLVLPGKVANAAQTYVMCYPAKAACEMALQRQEADSDLRWSGQPPEVLFAIFGGWAFLNSDGECVAATAIAPGSGLLFEHVPATGEVTQGEVDNVCGCGSCVKPEDPSGSKGHAWHRVTIDCMQSRGEQWYRWVDAKSCPEARPFGGMLFLRGHPAKTPEAADYDFFRLSPHSGDEVRVDRRFRVADRRDVVDRVRDSMHFGSRERMQPMRERHWCTPTLYAAPTGKRGDTAVQFRPGHTWVLIALGETEPIVGRAWRPGKLQQELIRDRIDVDGDGALTVEEIIAFCKDEEHRKWIRSLPSSVHGFTSEQMVHDAFDAFDINNDGIIDKNEWGTFIARMEDRRLQFLQKNQLDARKSFFGRGQSWLDDEEAPSFGAETGSSYPVSNEPDENTPLNSQQAADINLYASQQEYPTFQCGLDPDLRDNCVVPPGWWDDLYYYSANQHPLHSIFACDPACSLQSGDRLLMEVTTCGFCFLTSTLKTYWIDHGYAPWAFLTIRIPGTSYPVFFSLLCVTFPGMLISQILYYLFTLPCGRVDFSRADLDEIQTARRWVIFGNMIAYCLIAAGMYSLALVGLKIHSVEHDETLERHQACLMGTLVLVSRLQGYLISWLVMVALRFNPFVAWGQTAPNEPVLIGDRIGVGTWRIEKQRFKRQCRMVAGHKWDDPWVYLYGQGDSASAHSGSGASSPARDRRRAAVTAVELPPQFQATADRWDAVKDCAKVRGPVDGMRSAALEAKPPPTLGVR